MSGGTSARRTCSVVITVVALELAGAGIALAAPQPPPGVAPPRGAQQGPRGGQAAGGLTPQDLEFWLDSYVLLQAQDALKLSDAQFAQFVGRFKQLMTVRRRHTQGRRQILGTLNRLLRTVPFDEPQVRDRLRALREADVRAAEELRRAYDGLDEVLDLAQQARFKVFEENVERKKFDLLLRARRGVAATPGPAAPPIR